MKKVKLGSNITLDVAKLVETRILYQANSGAGKSWLLRKTLEMTHGQVQQIVLDPEGEFATLREKYDYVLAGKGGDVEANPRTAEMLAHKTLELGFSLIVDLYELKKHDRILFVKNFLDAMINAPKELWHPVLVVIDEAHIFCPEKGESEAAGAVIDLATRGRKRGFCAALATQRLSKLHKDAASECNNKLIGRTGLDIDRKRASEELGFTSREESLSLRTLKPGEFYFFGPALSDEVKVGTIGAVETTHPKAGQRMGFKNVKPTHAIKAVLQKLADLPQEAKADLADKTAMKARIRELEIELRKKPKETTIEKVGAPKVSKTEIKTATKSAAAQLKREVWKEISRDVDELTSKIKKRLSEIKVEPVIETRVTPRYAHGTMPGTKFTPDIPSHVSAERSKQMPIENAHEQPKLGICERKILGFLASQPTRAFSRVQVGAMTGYAHDSGSFRNAVSMLNTAGLIQRSGDTLKVAAGADVSHLVDEVPHTLADWLSKLGLCERKIYNEALRNAPEVIGLEYVGEATGYEPTSGSFRNAVSRLSTLGLVERMPGQGIRLNAELAAFL